MSELDYGPWKPGQIVVLNDGKLGRMDNPRGCFCGPNGEACWDIALVGETGGVQAHGGTWRAPLDHERNQR